MSRKTAGIIGGIGPESTIAYYRGIVAGYRQRVQDGSYPKVLINSIDLKALLDHVAAGRLDELTEWLGVEIERVAQAGADFALLASNTPHIVFERLLRCAKVPLISIVDAARIALEGIGASRPLLLGTRFTMQARFYRSGLGLSGIAPAVPSSAEQDRVHEIYTGELLNGILRPESRAVLEAIIRRTKAQDSTDAVLLAGTELSLLLREEGYEGLPVIDTTKAHVARIVAALVS